MERGQILRRSAPPLASPATGLSVASLRGELRRRGARSSSTGRSPHSISSTFSPPLGARPVFRWSRYGGRKNAAPGRLRPAGSGTPFFFDVQPPVAWRPGTVAGNGGRGRMRRQVAALQNGRRGRIFMPLAVPGRRCYNRRRFERHVAALADFPVDVRASRPATQTRPAGTDSRERGSRSCSSTSTAPSSSTWSSSWA